MKKLIRFIFWSVVFVILLVAADQALLRVELDLPGYREARGFYQDFRSRLLNLGERPSTGVSTEQGSSESSEQAGPSYVYVDAEGSLHFAESLEEVPSRYRENAQELGR